MRTRRGPVRTGFSCELFYHGTGRPSADSTNITAIILQTARVRLTNPLYQTTHPLLLKSLMLWTTTAVNWLFHTQHATDIRSAEVKQLGELVPPAKLLGYHARSLVADRQWISVLA